MSPPARSEISCAARRLAQSQMPTSAPRSKRYDESLRNPSSLLVRRMFVGLKYALSIKTSCVRSLISVFCPPMMPASAMPFTSSAMSNISPVSVRAWPSSVVNFSPSTARRTTMVGTACASVAASR